MLEEFFDALRHLFVILWIWTFFPSILAFGSQIASEKTELHFKAFRLQQYEFSAKQYGSSSWKVLYETVSLNGSALRKCLVVDWWDLVNKELESTIGAAVGAVLVIIPEDLDSLTVNERAAFQAFEHAFTNFRTDQAVYFAHNSSALRQLYQSIAVSSKRAPSAFQQLYNGLAANSFQIASTGSGPTTKAASAKHFNIIVRSSIERDVQANRRIF